MAEIKVSVIIPVYNTEAYVADALNSILDQTLREIEVIVINDGSTDNSYEVVKSIADSDDRISLYQQENKGLSETRNRGMSMAQGKYIYFMDSDDLLDKNTLLECYEKCKAHDLDFVFFDADVFGESVGTLNLNYHRTHLINAETCTGISMLEHFFEVGGYQPSACLSFIRSSFLKRIGLSFYPGIIHEDELFTFLLYLNAYRVGYINKACFKRRLRPNSIMVNKFSPKSIEGYITVISELIHVKETKEDPQIGKLVDRRVSDILGGVLYNSRWIRIKDRYRLLLQCGTQLKRHTSIKNAFLLVFPISRYLRKSPSH